MNPSQKSPPNSAQTNEQKRLNDARNQGIPWKMWGPYLSPLGLLRLVDSFATCDPKEGNFNFGIGEFPGRRCGYRGS